MPRQITVEVSATADATPQFEKYNADADRTQPVSVEIHLSPIADSEAEAIVRALRHASDVAASRLGLLDRMDGPPARALRVIEALLEADHAQRDQDEQNGLFIHCAQELAAEYGYTIRDEPSGTIEQHRVEGSE